MSIVGPRPHMLAHTETYARLIDKYMVRHFIKPGVTGWAQTMVFVVKRKNYPKWKAVFSLISGIWNIGQYYWIYTLFIRL